MTTEFLDLQALVGITKHTGGPVATRELLQLCHVDEAREILDIGCGIGAGLVGIARDHPCRVVGIDRSDRMIEWSRRRVREHGLADRVELRVADVTDLPFEDGRFDAVLAESVLAFVDDKALALREMARVTRPRGCVGLNESIWTRQPTPEVEALARDMGARVETVETWRALYDQAGLGALVVKLRRVDPGAELRNRLRWIGLPTVVAAWGRTAQLYVTRPDARESLQSMFGPGLETFDSVGYGLFVGRVPA